MSRVSPLRRFPGFSTAAWAFFAYLYVPVIVLVALAFNGGTSATIWGGFSVKWFGTVANNPDILRATWNSLIVATVSSLVATAMATPAAIAMAHRRFRGQNAVTAVIAMPLIVPEIVTAVATLLFFSAVALPLGLVAMILAHIVFCIPFAYLPVRARMEGMDPALAEAASDLYADGWRVFTRVTLPLLWPGILSGLMLAFIISLDDFVISFFVSGAGATTLPIYIYGMIRIGVSPEVNAVSAMLLVVSIVFVALSWVVGRLRR